MRKNLKAKTLESLSSVMPITASAEGSRLHFTWEKDGQRASLDADLTTCGFPISITDASGALLYQMEQ